MLRGCDVLVAEDQYMVLPVRLLQALEINAGQWPGQVQPEHFGPQITSGSGDRSDHKILGGGCVSRGRGGRGSQIGAGKNGRHGALLKECSINEHQSRNILKFPEGIYF